MKKIVYIIGALISSLVVLGALFKILHWPGADILLLVGMGGFALIFIPFFAIYRYNKS